MQLLPLVLLQLPLLPLVAFGAAKPVKLVIEELKADDTSPGCSTGDMWTEKDEADVGVGNFTSGFAWTYAGYSSPFLLVGGGDILVTEEFKKEIGPDGLCIELAPLRKEQVLLLDGGT